MEKQATFRFYEELNDFLPAGKKKVEFVHSFKGNPSIKDCIESMGVPHVEVDLILVNGNSVDFNYILQDHDRVSVYPVFETLEMSGVTHLRAKPLRYSTFILDVHLGKLARYLRMLGFDTMYQNDNDDNEIIRISLDEHRIILTRDIGLLKVKSVTHAYFVRDQHPKAQLAEVLNHFDLYKAIQPFVRCIKCNGLLKRVDKEEIIQHLEPLTIQFFNEFSMCTNCHSVFWKGSHYESMQYYIKTIMDSI